MKGRFVKETVLFHFPILGYLKFKIRWFYGWLYWCFIGNI
jgi:hypothetical protein